MHTEEQIAMLHRADDLYGKIVRIKLKSGRIASGKLCNIDFPWETNDEHCYICVPHKIGPGIEPFDLFEEVESIEEIRGGDGAR